jgi:transcriptional regulator with XRE-family HTH domain
MASLTATLGGPAVVGIVLGTQLRRLRKAKGITVEVASHALGASHTKISRMEHGRVGFKAREVADLLTLYGVTDQHQRQTLLTLALQANAADWAHYYSDLLPSWGATYLGLEQASSVIRTYQPQVIPDLLQTEDVARALQRLRHPSDCGLDIERRVAMQMTRQEILTEPSAPSLWAVIDQAALWWLAGSSALGEQVRHLLTMAQLPHVRLQMLPISSGEHVTTSGPLTILRFADPELPDVVYHQQQTTTLCLDQNEDVQHYRALMDNIGTLAKTPKQTITYLSALLTNECPQARLQLEHPTR